MARLTGPLMSMSASGSIGGVIVFSTWKGRAYARQLVRPANPKSGGQVSMRAFMKFLSQAWAGGTPTQKSSWEDMADAGVFSPFNAYTKYNLGLNKDFLAPVQQLDLVTPITPSVIATFAATAGTRSIAITISDDGIQDINWGFFLYRSTTSGFTPAFDNLIALVVADGTNVVTHVDTPLVPDTYYYDAKPFTNEGDIGALKGEINGIVA